MNLAPTAYVCPFPEVKKFRWGEEPAFGRHIWRFPWPDEDLTPVYRRHGIRRYGRIYIPTQYHWDGCHAELCEIIAMEGDRHHYPATLLRCTTGGCMIEIPTALMSSVVEQIADPEIAVRVLDENGLPYQPPVPVVVELSPWQQLLADMDRALTGSDEATSTNHAVLLGGPLDAIPPAANDRRRIVVSHLRLSNGAELLFYNGKLSISGDASRELRTNAAFAADLMTQVSAAIVVAHDEAIRSATRVRNVG